MRYVWKCVTTATMATGSSDQHSAVSDSCGFSADSVTDASDYISNQQKQCYVTEFSVILCLAQTSLQQH